MSATALKASRREIRRAFGSQAVSQLHDQEIAITVLCEVLARGFWGRMRWLFLGR